MAQDLQEIRNLPDKLQELSYNINDSFVTLEIHKLVKEGRGVAHCVAHAFSVRGTEVLERKYKLSKERCPGKVDVDNLSLSLLTFKESINDCYEQAYVLKTRINNFIEMSRGKKKYNETVLENAQIELLGIDKQIRLTEQEIIKYEEDALSEDRGAKELENRSIDLRRESKRHREKGVGWSLISFGVGLLFAPFTGGASLLPALASAGIGIKVNFDNANDCDRTAAKLRFSAGDKRDKAKTQRKMKQEFESKKTSKTNELRNRKETIEKLSRTCNGLTELQSHLLASVSGFERAIYIVQDFQNAVHMAMLQGDAFALIREVFTECPDDFHDEAHKGLYNLKIKWAQLEELFVSNSDHRGIEF